MNIENVHKGQAKPIPLTPPTQNIAAVANAMTYAASTGNRFLRVDPEGNGQPRRVHLDITLSEPNPAGGVYNYNVPTDMNLDPLYDVAIGPLYFSLLNDCATF